MKRVAGFGLVEALLALSLGLLLILATSRLFLAALHSGQAQGVAAQLQEDARFALQRLARDIRMAGMLGCLRREAISFVDPTAAAAFALPLGISLDPEGNLRSLSLVSTEAGELGGRPDWTLVTDCRSVAQVHAGEHAAGPGAFALPVRQQVYRLTDGALLLSSGGSHAVLIEHVRELNVDLGVADANGEVEYRRGPVDPARIRSLRMRLTLEDPQQRVRAQTYQLVATVRNRLP